MLKKSSENAAEVVRTANERKSPGSPKRSTNVGHVPSIQSHSLPDAQPRTVDPVTEAFSARDKELHVENSSQVKYVTQSRGRFQSYLF